jgi:elongation factor P--(R)-beta-lysine ligase
VFVGGLSELTRDELEYRAHQKNQMRVFFAVRKVLEVDTPCLGEVSGTDPFIEPLVVRALASDQGVAYLQTSPEFAMKRLLAQGSGCIYQLARAFRADPEGRWHRPEFLMLEWYRVGMDSVALSQEVLALMEHLCGGAQLRVKRMSYRQWWLQGVGLDPFDITTEGVRQRFGRAISEVLTDADPLSSWLDWVVSHHLQPSLPQDQVTIVEDFPICCASLARLSEDGAHAKRFEIYWGSVEVANGFEELTDAAQQRARFQQDNVLRVQMGLPQIPLDEVFLAALDAVPDCSGVALGWDRLLALLGGRGSL